MKYEVKVTELSVNDIETILDGAFDFCEYWAEEIRLDVSNVGIVSEQVEVETTMSKYALALLNGGTINFVDIEDSNKVYVLDYKGLLKGVEMFITNHKKYDISKMFNGQEDAYDMDIIIQYAIFGELVFG